MNIAILTSTCSSHGMIHSLYCSLSIAHSLLLLVSIFVTLYCSLSTAHSLLRHSLLLTVYSSLSTAHLYCSLSTAHSLLLTLYCSLSTAHDVFIACGAHQTPPKTKLLIIVVVVIMQCRGDACLLHGKCSEQYHLVRGCFHD